MTDVAPYLPDGTGGVRFLLYMEAATVSVTPSAVSQIVLCRLQKSSVKVAHSEHSTHCGSDALRKGFGGTLPKCLTAIEAL